MSLVLRLLLLAHASTDALADVRFPADDPLSDRGRRELRRVHAPAVDHTLSAPERCTVETAAALGMCAEPDAALRELDYGTWTGRPMSAVPEADLAVWLTDPHAAPHGGESIATLLDRTRCWLDTMAGRSGRWLAVTHPSVVRAATVCALGAPVSAFWRVDVRPVSITRLHARDGRWTLRLT
ncbi:histidine phosphatase family protein [Rhodococcus sp. HM1]|uniref:histidine phosphatase family protein n=1 Tax=unclassified Rhodococcus (in: high G+C Gram-positive bacteria) TaxID=192944 RepID=UPI0018CF6454|nr:MULTISPECIES: histidine phosphatase family protein [unclassified Rhodococcus (in: high G+C Gram-positive bacteria)]MBH0122126.1 histidine phosphatase family protein [Rhodococcus sp. CX]MCK8669607.1 histidine phosphatase family protein [Rhodococcus sp. HM1]